MFADRIIAVSKKAAEDFSLENQIIGVEKVYKEVLEN